MTRRLAIASHAPEAEPEADSTPTGGGGRASGIRDLSARARRFGDRTQQTGDHARASTLAVLLGIGRRPRHAAPQRFRLAPLAACLTALALLALGTLLEPAGPAGQASADTVIGGHGETIMGGQPLGSAALPVALPPATAPPAPAPPSLAGAPALRAHEVFAFAPYWDLASQAGIDVGDLTTLAYFSVDVNGDGSIQQSGPGWVGYQSQALADLTTRAHQAGARVVLGASCFGQSALDELTSDPGAARQLAAALVQLVSAKNLDGVNLDFEGRGDADQVGLDDVVAQVSAAVHQANPHWQVTMDTYASSAADPGGFYDIRGLAASVDAFFVMAYDMNDKATPSPTSPLTGPSFSDVDALQQFTAVVPSSKVILGVPYYGYDWPTAGPGLGEPATGPPTPVPYSQVASSGHHVYWDPVTQTPWTSYLVGTQWHQTWFDDATSLALKARLATTYHLAGLGIWALGMDGGDPSLLAALLGNAPVVKNLPAGPAAAKAPAGSSTTAVPAGGYRYAGTWDGVTVTLVAVDPATAAGPGAAPVAGQLTGFTTNDPAAACLATGPPLEVTASPSSPGLDVVTASVPQDCAAGTWEFAADASPTTTSTTSTTFPTPTTSTTTATSTTSTTSTPTTSTTSTTLPSG